MKFVLAAFVVTVFGLMWAYAPGGPANRHRWYSDVVNDTYPAAKAEYEKCMATTPKGLLFNGNANLCISPSHYSIIELRYENPQNSKQDSCVDIDFCVRHGESRVLPCYSEKK